VAILAAALVSYHMHGYDLTLLLIPIGEAFRKGFGSAGAWCAAIFFVPIVSTPLYLLAINNGFAYLFAIPIFAFLIQFHFTRCPYNAISTATTARALAQMSP
jgi:hypothetical protein